MKFNFRIWHFLFLTWLVILVIRFEPLLNIYLLIFNWIALLFDNSKIAFAQLNFGVIDNIASGKLFIILPVIFILFRKKLSFLYERINYPSLFLTLLVVSFLFAPLISNKNPDFYKNIGVTKLLPPLTTVEILHYKNDEAAKTESPFEKFISLKNKVIRKSFDASIEFIDSISVDEEIFFFQKGIRKETGKENLIIKNSKPLITKQIFWLGSDQFGRDVLTRLIYGARVSILVGFGSVIISLLLGITFGFLAGYTGGIFDIIFSRITDMFLSFPVIFLVVLILALFGNSLLAVIAVLGFAGWMSLFKIVKTEVLSVKEKNYFISAKLLGLSKKQLLIREVLPVIIVPVVVNIIFQFGNVIIAESALSYLGLGLGENYPSWGSMIQAGQEYLSSAWWMIFFPGMTLIFTLLSANSFGAALNRKLNPFIK